MWRAAISAGLCALLALGPAIAAGAPILPYSSGTLKRIDETGIVRLGHRENSPPFAFLDAKKKPIGYSLDICEVVVDEIAREVGKELTVEYRAVTPENRFELVSSGVIDLECGSTTNNLERQKQVSFTITHFVTANRFVSKKTADLKTVDDLRNKTIVSTSGTTNIKQITEIGAQKNLGLNILAAKDHAEAFLMVETDRAAAFVMDDILLYSLVASSKSPQDYVISADALSVEPYGIMLRREDPDFKKVVDGTMVSIYKSGDINAIYEKWFLKPVPPRGINLNLPMSPAFKKVVASPTDSGDPAVY